MTPKIRSSQARFNDDDNPVLDAIERTFAELHAAGLADKTTLTRFDKAALTPVVQMSPVEIKALREAAHVSQSVLALTLNVSRKTVEAWELGSKRPSGPTLKLLTLAKTKGLEYVK